LVNRLRLSFQPSADYYRTQEFSQTLRRSLMITASISRIVKSAIPTIMVYISLASGSSAMAQSAAPSDSRDGRCSNRTLSGNYGFTLEGVLVGPNLPIRGVVMQHYDGKGNITQVDHVVVGGFPPAQEWMPGTGTYSVNPDCTGTAVLHTPTNPDVNLHFVIVRRGREIHQVVDADAVTAIGIKVE
jgi:hypothetical protein